MKKRYVFVAAFILIALCLSNAIAEDWTPLLAEDGWTYIGYTYAGITFAVPKDYYSFELTEDDVEDGFVLIGGNDDFTLQMRVFQSEDVDYDTFKAMIERERTAEISTRMDGDSEILAYRNTRPNAYSELYGIALAGLDGLLYKISIFTGVDEKYGQDAPVWGIAETIAQSTRHQDFSEWGIEDAPSFSSDSLQSKITDFLNQFIEK